MSGKNPCKYEGSQVLLVEGLDDCHVVMSLCASHEISETFSVYECGSDKKVLQRMNALILRPDIPATIGVLLDADTGIEDRWKSIRAKLEKHGYSVPPMPDSEGTIIVAPKDEDKPKIGVWLMPNNTIQGMLEDFCSTMISEEALEYTRTCVHSAQEAGHCTFKVVHFSKAVIHTYLAWQEEPGRPLGQAITRAHLKSHTATARSFTQWLDRLFNADN